MNELDDKSSNLVGHAERRFVYAVVRRILRSETDADDVAQEALLLAHRHLAGFRGDSTFRTWLYRIATTTALGHLRRLKRARVHIPLTDVELTDPGKSSEELLGDAELAALIRDNVSKLKPHFRDVILARGEETEEEVAARLGLTVSNVKVRAHRARNQLRAALAPLVSGALGVAGEPALIV